MSKSHDSSPFGWRSNPLVQKLEEEARNQRVENDLAFYRRLHDPSVKLFRPYSVEYEEQEVLRKARKKLLHELKVPKSDCAWTNTERGVSLPLTKPWTHNPRKNFIPHFPPVTAADRHREEQLRDLLNEAAEYEDGVWTIEFSRAPTTDSETDVQFSDLAGTYYFGPAVLENAQVRHAIQSGSTPFVFLPQE